MFDLDADGELSLPEIELMVEELYGGEGAGKQCLQEITEFAEARGGALNL
jgi:GNAT superfamily N-acetyltransferase